MLLNMSILLLTALLVVLSTQTASGVGDVDEAEYSRSDRSVEMRTCEDLGFHSYLIKITLISQPGTAMQVRQSMYPKRIVSGTFD